MDDFSLGGSQVEEALETIANINRYLGGNQLTINAVKKILPQNPSRPITICDVGCGNGDMLRALANYAQKNKLNIKLIGVDANPFTIKIAQEKSDAYPNISYICANVLENHELIPPHDIALLTLFLHHFEEAEIPQIIQNSLTKSSLGVIINDLHRSAWAYYLFVAVCFVFRVNDLAKKDGLLSILRGFKKTELQNYAQKLNHHQHQIKWQWAFRYEWIIYKNKTTA